jgi:hypothetical protein
MQTTVIDRPQLRAVPNVGSQSKGQPGAPIDPIVLGFEGAFQGLVAEIDDAKSLKVGLALEKHLLHIFSIDATIAAATKGTDRKLQSRIRETRAYIVRVHEHLEERVDRLQKNIIPDQRNIVASLDVVMTEASKERRRERGGR